MKLFLFFILPLVLFANNFCVNIDDKVDVEELKKFVPSGILTSDDNIKNSFKRELFFANKALKGMTKDEKESLKIGVIKMLNNLEVNRILQKEKIKITKDIAYSYYLANKNAYRTKATIDLYVLIFKNEKEASSYIIGDKKIKPYSMEYYGKVELDNILPNYKMAIKGLKPKVLSKIYKKDDKFIRIYLDKETKAGYIPYKKVENGIKKELFMKKKKEILDEIYQK